MFSSAFFFNVTHCLTPIYHSWTNISAFTQTYPKEGLTIFSKPRTDNILAIFRLLFRTYSDNTIAGHRRDFAYGNMAAKLTRLNIRIKSRDKFPPNTHNLHLRKLTSYVERSSLKKCLTFAFVVSFSGARTTYVTSRDDVYGSKNSFSYRTEKNKKFAL